MFKTRSRVKADVFLCVVFLFLTVFWSHPPKSKLSVNCARSASNKNKNWFISCNSPDRMLRQMDSVQIFDRTCVNWLCYNNHRAGLRVWFWTARVQIARTWLSRNTWLICANFSWRPEPGLSSEFVEFIKRASLPCPLQPLYVLTKVSSFISKDLNGPISSSFVIAKRSRKWFSRTYKALPSSCITLHECSDMGYKEDDLKGSRDGFSNLR